MTETADVGNHRQRHCRFERGLSPRRTRLHQRARDRARSAPGKGSTGKSMGGRARAIRDAG